jgi:hypothetical protein
MMTVEEARSLLPNVGDVRMETPTTMKGDPAQNLQECTVVEVNRAHRWYTVEFKNGFRESYKVPRGTMYTQGGVQV